MRWRVTLLIIMLSTIIQGTLCVVMVLYSRRSLDHVMVQRMRLRVGQIAAEVHALQRPVVRDDLAVLEGKLLRFAIPERVGTIVYAADGGVIASTMSTPPLGSTLPIATLADTRQPLVRSLRRAEMPLLGDSSIESARIGMTAIDSVAGSTQVVCLIISDNYYHSMASSIERPVILLIAMGVVASGVAGWLVTGRLLGPLSRLTQLATALRPERLEEQDEGAPGASVAELQSVQQSLRETRDSLREAFRAQERFLSNVAHELKTPIAVLLAESQTIDRSVLGEEGGRFVNSVNEEMKRLGKLVESFLLLAKVHAGKALLKSDVVFLNDVVMGAVEQCGIMSRQYSVTLVPTLLEGEAANTTVAGDPTLLQTMIDGLIRNAIKFSPQGAQVHVKILSETDHLLVCVRDRGPGIAPEIVPMLFDRFVQASAERARGRGTGLGLAIAQGIAELHSGKITFANREDGGCEFCVRLPRAQLQPDELLGGA